jgi:hypothetical protein
MTTLDPDSGSAAGTGVGVDSPGRDFEAVGMTPLWRTREGLMPLRPEPRAVPHLWRWADLHPLAARSADLVAVGRGGERRAIGLGNPGRPGDPYVRRHDRPGFFEFGPEEVRDRATPQRSRNERLWAGPGLALLVTEIGVIGRLSNRARAR